MNLLYISKEQNKQELCGVDLKISNQVKELNKHNIVTTLCKFSYAPKWIRALPFQTVGIPWSKICIHNTIDAIYIRYCLSDFQFIRALSKWKKTHKNIKIILEIPTYPYDDEMLNWNKIIYIRDKIYRTQLYRYIDRIVTYTNDQSIYNINTICAVNGIAVEDVVPLKIKKYKKNEINIIAVAAIEFWHGYDRFLKGMAEYYARNGEQNIIFHLVGNGSVMPELKKYTKDHNLTDHVIFYGFKSGNDLDALYDTADIGIDVLGCHRKNEYCFGTLKSRQYMAKGLPFITEYALPDQVKPMEAYILKVPADESAIDIHEVIGFLNRMKQKEKETIIKDMRDFAKSYCDMSVVMSPIVEYLKYGTVTEQNAYKISR